MKPEINYGSPEEIKALSVPDPKPMIDKQARIIMDAAIATNNKWWIEKITSSIDGFHTEGDGIVMLHLPYNDWQQIKKEATE